MDYVDGFLVAVPAAKQNDYRKCAEESAVIFKEYGALSVVECWGDDVPEGKLTSFPMAVKREPDEVVVFSWIRWSSKEARDLGMQKAMVDERFKAMQMPFDGNRLTYGGFQMIVEA